MDEPFLTSECVSCGACVQACPTATLMEKSVVEMGQPEHSVVTTCAYCGVGCNFKAEMRGDQVVRMVPWKDGKANHGHSCVKGRFAWGYASHPDRILQPMIREKITDPWREVTWDEAIGRVASEFKRIQAQAWQGFDRRHHLVTLHRRRSLSGAEADRARRSATTTPTPAPGSATRRPATAWARPSAPRPARRISTVSRQSDVIIVIGANPTDGHPVFASRMKKRLRAGREADRHRSAADRPGAHAACGGGLSSAAAARAPTSRC